MPRTTSTHYKYQKNSKLGFLIKPALLFIFVFIIIKLNTHKSHVQLSVMDTFYISHGSPTLSIDESLEARHFLKAWKDKTFSEKPNAILVISGHWETDVPTVNSVQQHDTIHDFYGFPQEMYKVRFFILIVQVVLSLYQVMFFGYLSFNFSPNF